MLEWRGGGLPLSAGMGCADAFTCPCGRPKIHGDRTSVAYSTGSIECILLWQRQLKHTFAEIVSQLLPCIFGHFRYSVGTLVTSVVAYSDFTSKSPDYVLSKAFQPN